VVFPKSAKPPGLFLFNHSGEDCHKLGFNDKKRCALNARFNIHSTPFMVPELENESTPRSQNQKSVNHIRNISHCNNQDFLRHNDQSISTLHWLEDQSTKTENSTFQEFNENIRFIEKLLAQDDVHVSEVTKSISVPSSEIFFSNFRKRVT